MYYVCTKPSPQCVVPKDDYFSNKLYCTQSRLLIVTIFSLAVFTLTEVRFNFFHFCPKRSVLVICLKRKKL